MMIVVIALVLSIMLFFGKGTKKIISTTNNLTAGEKINLSKNENWQEEIELLSLENQYAVQNEDDTKKTVTEKVSTSLVSNYLSLKESGTLNEENATKLVDQSIDYISKSTSVSDISSLKISKTNDFVAMEKYGNDLGNVFKKNKPSSVKNEMQILSDSVTKRDPKSIEEMDSIINTYEAIMYDMKSMEVPKLFAQSHLDMINGLNRIVTSLKDIKGVFSDPFKSLASLQTYQEGVTLFTTPLRATIKYFVKNNIVYKQGTGGYYLLYGI